MIASRERRERETERGKKMGVAVLDNRVIGAALEATPGTFNSAGIAFDFRARDISYSEEIEEYVRKYAHGDHGYDESVPGRQGGTISFSVDLAGSGTAGTAPVWGKLIRAAGYVEAIDPGVSVSYTTSRAADCSTLSLEIRDLFCGTPGKQLTTRFAGAVAKSKVVLDNVGAPLRLELEFTGKLVSVTDENPIFPTITEATIPPAVLNATATLDGVAQALDKVEVDGGEDVQRRTSPAEATGWIHAFIAKRELKGTIDPELTLVATDDVIGKWKGGSTGPLEVSAGAVAGNVIKLSAPKAQIVNAPTGERNGAVTRDIELRFLRDAGNDDFAITIE
jgi:hypothetical protein